MPVKVKHLDGGLGALFKGEGVVTGQDILAANKEMFSSIEKTKKYKYGLADWTDITEYRVSSRDLEEAAAQDKDASIYNSDLFVAVVADKDMPFGFSRMWATFIEVNKLNWETMVFRKRDDAETWLKKKMKEKFQIDINVA